MENIDIISKHIDTIEVNIEQACQTEQIIESDARKAVLKVRGRKMYRKWFMILLFFAIWVASEFVYPSFKTDLLLIITVYALLYGLIIVVTKRYFQQKETNDLREVVEMHQDDFSEMASIIHRETSQLNQLQKEWSPLYYRRSFLDYYRQKEATTPLDKIFLEYDYQQGSMLSSLEKHLLLNENKNDSEFSKSLVIQIISRFTSLDASIFLDGLN